MHCKACGSNVSDTAQFCEKCGAPIARESTNETNEPSLLDFYESVPESEDDSIGVYMVPESFRTGNVYEPNRKDKRSKRKFVVGTIAIGALAVAAALVGVLVFVLPRMGGIPWQGSTSQATESSSDDSKETTTPAEGDQKSKENGENAASDDTSDGPANEAKGTDETDDIIILPVSVPGLDLNGSRIPILVTGTTADDTPFEEVMYIYDDGTGIHLPAGNYTANVVETPISAEGVLYYIPNDSVTIVISESAEDDSEGYDQPSIKVQGDTLVLRQREASDATDELIELARSWIQKDPRRTESADALAARARERLHNS